MADLLELAARTRAQYHPCQNGLHVCYGDDDGFHTVLNLPCETADEARALFDRAKAECQILDGDPHDLVVDLNLYDKTGWGHCDDFLMSRQMLARLRGMSDV